MDRVDLDRYAAPPRDPETLAARREALLEQLGWLADEAAALAPLLAALPAWAIDQAPLPDERSLRQTLARLAWLDEAVYPAWLAALADGADAVPPPPPEPSETPPEATLETLLAAIAAARAALRARAEALAPDALARRLRLDGQETDGYGLLLAITQRDADVLRTLAYRLYEADLSGRGGA
ncbi:MAG: DinB family protein [Rubricoccaceae bacterium]